MQAFLLGILGADRALHARGGGAVRARRAARCATGERFALPELGDLLERLGAEGPGFLYSGDVAAAVSDWVLERGGLLTRADLAAYEVDRAPAARGRASAAARCSPTRRPPRAGS